MLLALRFASMSGTATVYATHFPSGEIAGSAMRCNLIKSSKVIACFVSCARTPNAIAQHTAVTVQTFCIIFIDSSYLRSEATQTLPLQILPRFAYYFLFPVFYFPPIGIPTAQT